MLRNYLVVAWRNLARYKTYSAINIAGLAVGMTSCLLIVLFVQHELSYDRFHQNSEHIYRLAGEGRSGNREWRSSQVSLSSVKKLREIIPEFEQSICLFQLLSTSNQNLVKYDDRQLYEEKVRFVVAEKNFFDFFSFPLIKGDPQTALQQPNTVVISQSAAKKIFADEDPLGKVLQLPNQRMEATITGVLQDIPYNSHFKFDYLFSFEQQEIHSSFYQHASVFFYFLLPGDSSPEVLEQQLSQYIRTDEGFNWTRSKENAFFRLFLQPLTDIHLHSHLNNEWEVNRNISDLYLFSLIAFLILIIACINFMNLATARWADRAREVGVRKSAGAQRSQLIRQFMGEAFFYTGASLLLALVLTELFAPLLNTLANTKIDVSLRNSWSLWIGLVVISLFVGGISGSYPALFLSSFAPVQVLKGSIQIGSRSRLFRRVLVVVQFTISTVLILVTGVTYSQMRYTQEKEMGFDHNQVLVIQRGLNQWNLETFKNEVMKNPRIIGVTGSMKAPGLQEGPLRFKSNFNVVGGSASPLMGETLFVDHDFCDVLKIEMAAGRDFSRSVSSDEEGAFLINEEAARRWGWSEPLEKEMEVDIFRHQWKGRVIGVAKDFHMRSLHHSIEPLVLLLHPQKLGYCTVYRTLIRVHTEDLPETLAFIEEKWRAFEAEDIFQYSFLDEDFGRLYRTERRQMKLLGLFSLLAIFIACLGLFGLTVYTAERRTKEIGIRKILGASIASVVILLSKELIWLVVGANIIAWPIAYYFTNQWLQNFAYRIDLGIGFFTLIGILVLLTAWTTMSYQAIKAALSNPVDALRYE